jgi:hypothetical protein
MIIHFTTYRKVIYVATKSLYLFIHIVHAALFYFYLHVTTQSPSINDNILIEMHFLRLRVQRGSKKVTMDPKLVASLRDIGQEGR